MTFDIIAFPWTKYKELFEQGKLNDNEFRCSPENDALWDESPALSAKVGNSYGMYYMVIEDTAWLNHLEFPGKEPFLKFATAVIAEQYENDLGKRGEVEGIDAVLSPERIADIAEAASRIDFDEVREAHARLSTEGVDEEGEGELEPVDTQLDTDEYVDYVKAFAEFVMEINDPDRCLAIRIG